MTKRNINIKTLEMFGDEQWRPDDFLMKIAAAVASIPPEYRDTTGWVSMDGYDSRCEFVISYERLENDEEYAARLASEKQWAEQIAQRDLELYRKLREKFKHIEV